MNITRTINNNFHRSPKAFCQPSAPSLPLGKTMWFMAWGRPRPGRPVQGMCKACARHVQCSTSHCEAEGIKTDSHVYMLQICLDAIGLTSRYYIIIWIICHKSFWRFFNWSVWLILIFSGKSACPWLSPWKISPKKLSSQKHHCRSVASLGIWVRGAESTHWESEDPVMLRPRRKTTSMNTI